MTAQLSNVAIDVSKHPLIKQAYDVCQAIEKCGASPELTDAVTKACALMQGIANAMDSEPVAWWTGPEPTPTGEIESIHDHETGSHSIPLFAGYTAPPAPVAVLKLPPKLSNDRESAHELNAGVDTWNRCIDEVAKLNGCTIAANPVEGLHPSTVSLVNDFATALAEKLRKAEQKYGYSNAWTNNGWMTECQADFHRHIAKGDPRDVAAYCAFMWYHGWKTEPAPVAVPDVVMNAVRAIDACLYHFHHESHGALAAHVFERILRECRDAMLAEPVTAATVPDGWKLVPIEPTEAMMLHKSGCQHHAWDDADCAMRQTRRLVWAHMLAAAPAAPEQEV